MVDLLQLLFTESMWERTLIVFTRWAQDKTSKGRRLAADETEQRKKEEMHELLSKKLLVEKKVPVVFIDNVIASEKMRKSAERDEVKAFESALREIRCFV